MTSFTHLHVSSGFSFRYGTSQPEDLVARAAEFEMQRLALTDRDGMAGAIRFAAACEAQGISPVLGVNLSFVHKKYRVTLLAQTGHLASLYRLVSAVNADNDENILTHQLLEKFSEYSSKIFIMHGADSEIGSLISSKKIAQAISAFRSLEGLFARQGIECVSHQSKTGDKYSTAVAGRLLGFARDYQLDAVLSNAARMRSPSDVAVADVLDAVRNRSSISDNIIERSNAEAYVKNTEQMHFVADEIARAAGERSGRFLLNTTQSWAEMATLSPRTDIGLGQIHLPEPSVLGVKTHADLVKQLRSRCEAGLGKKYIGDLSVQAGKRLEEELGTVQTLGYESYFLTVADIADIARNKGIRVAARGSGAGSLICHLLGISEVEPLKHGLLMERFCSPLRNELPDIDIDVESARRLEIYDAVFKKYGDRVATVSMVETYRARSAIRDAGLALGISEIEVGLLAKSLPHIRARNIEGALEKLPELKHFRTNPPLLKAAIGIAGKLDGLPRHLAMHPCAIALSDIGLRDRAPVTTSGAGYPMLHFDKDDVEAIGLLKLDVLGVRMQSAISYSIEEIKRNGGNVELDEISLEDEKTFELIRSTRTIGLFQIESPGQRELQGKLGAKTFNDLIIGISLFRPGPVKSDMITPFLNTRHKFKERMSIHPKLDSILRETEGVVVFHEQVIKIIATMTGATYAQADEKRRLMGSREGQQEVCDWFYPSAIANSYNKKVVDQIWEVLRAFASFGFCKAHAAAFAMPTYQSAWLKTHYPAEFLAGVLTHSPGMYPTRMIIDEARQLGIEIAPIDVNKSGGTYLVEQREKGHAIRIPLSAVGGINNKEIENIIAARPYLDLADFVYRSGASTKTAEALVALGAFDQIHEIINNRLDRRDLQLHLADLDKFSGRGKGKSQMVLDLAATEIYSAGLPKMTDGEKLNNELELTGIDSSVHLLRQYSEFLNAIGAVKSCDVIKKRSGESVLVAGMKVSLQTPPIKSGKRVMFLTLEDGFGCNDLTFFEDSQISNAATIRNHSLLLARGVLRRTGERGISLRAEKAWDLIEEFNKWCARRDSNP